MDLVQLIYVSRLSPECDAKALKQILDASRRNNREHGLTGILCRDQTFFLQALEGSRQAVNTVYAAILRDERHTDAVILSYREITRRDFEAWSMAYVPAKDVDRTLALRYSATDRLDPYALSSEAARGFLADLEAVRRSSLEGAHAEA
jgi:hypothetical protein